MQLYWLNEPGQQTKGPFSLAHLEEMAKNNSVSARAKVCLVGNTDWIDLKQITKAGLIQPPILPQTSGGPSSYIPPPALPQTSAIRNPITPPQIPTLTNPNTVPRPVPVIAIFGLMFGLLLLLLSGSMIFLFGVKNESPSPDEKKEPLAKIVKGEDLKKANPANKEKVVIASLVHRQKVWELKDELLKKTVSLLSSDEANNALADLANFAKEPAEEKVRLFLYERRGQGLLKKAAELLKELPPDALEEFKKIIPEDQPPENMVLDWLTYESLGDFGYLLKIWQEQGKAPLKGNPEVVSLFKGLKEKPLSSKGVDVEKSPSQSIKLKLYGSSFDEKIAYDNNDNARFSSSFQSLYKELGRKDATSGDATFSIRTDGKFEANFWPALKTFATNATRTIWLSPIFHDSTNAAATLIVKSPSEPSTNMMGTAVPGNQKLPLQELFSKLAPSVPLIINPGISSGSGFLVNFKGRYYVVTNRHVVDGAKQKGVNVKFFTGDKNNTDKSFDINPTIARIIDVHPTADLALIDVHGARNMLEEQSIKPVPLPPKKHSPQVGENVFAIGHPGGGNKILTRTLSNGIISAVGRKMMNSMFLQVTVPLNPGNSGGPLFDEFGRVVGVNTFIIRKSADKVGIALEALNFSLEIAHVYELLDRNHDNLAFNENDDANQNDQAAATKKMNPAIALLTEKGYKFLNGTQAKSSQSFNLGPGGSRVIEFESGAKPLIVITSGCVGSDDIDLAVTDKNNEQLAIEDDVGDAPSLSFRNKEPGMLSLIVFNPTDKPTIVAIAFMAK